MPSSPAGRAAAETSSEPALTTVVADDDPAARRRVREVLEAAGILVVAEAHDGHEAVALTLHYRPDVLLMAASMRKLDGIAATRLIAKRDPGRVVVLLTRAGEDELAWLGLQAGAAGSVRKDMDLSCLPRVLRGAAAGEAAVSRIEMRRVIERLRRLPG
jgi:two-component system, NarL family, response regulator LiaR